MIRKQGEKFIIYSESGKKLGEFNSKEEAEKRLKQIEFFKALETHPGIAKKKFKK